MTDSRPVWTNGRALIAMAIGSTLFTAVAAQQRGGGEGGAADAVIERMALDLRGPGEYQVPLRLQPMTSLRLVARVDGIVEDMLAETGESVSAQEEVVRQEPGIRQTELERARAAFQLAQLEHGASGDQSRALAAARLELATLDLRLAEERLEDLILRAPFAGTITDVHVVAGQFVRAGDPLVTLADLSQLTVDVPVSRNDVSEGDTIEIRVEDTLVSGEVAQILPLSDELEPLRDLFLAIATARVTLSGAGLSPGQTVSSEMIPRHPVAEIPTVALRNTDDGQRKVQVIREEYVRDVVVRLHGQNGEEHVFVSGRFEPADELVVESSRELLDGMRIVPPGAADRPTGRRLYGDDD